MNTLLVLTCETCQRDIDCRIGFSNRRIQPLSFVCPHCNSPISITLDTTAAPGFSLTYAGAAESERSYAPFDGRNPFIDLHLDFPVSFGPYQLGKTPFFEAIARIETEAAVNHEQALALLGYISGRLNILNHLAERGGEIGVIIRLYFGANKQLFKHRVQDFLGQDLGPSLKPQDINAALYLFVSAVFQPFVHHENIADFVDSMTRLIMHLGDSKPEALNSFMDHMKETRFLENLQRDSLGLYAAVFDAEIALRPAIFLDVLPNATDKRIAGRVSAREFAVYKDLYKDLCEVYGRQLILIAGINNIIHRDSHDAFAPSQDGPAISSLDRFANKTLSEKFKYLDECWYVVDREAVSIELRNAISHHLVTYNELTQTVTYFPEKEGVRQERAESMTFLAFMRLLLELFREVHYIQHVIKTLLFYEILVRANVDPGAGNAGPAA